MDNVPVSTVALWLLGIFGTVFVGVMTNALWDWIKDNVSYSSARWPRLRGQWTISHAASSRLPERVTITQQFGARFQGELHTPDPSAPDRMLVQIVKGELLDKYHALFTMRQRGNDFTEIGAGLITIDASQVAASGKSVFFGATAPQEGIATFTMKRHA